MISSLKYIAQERKCKLITYLNNNTDELPLEKQHQIYGAITELDSITEILNGHRHKEIHSESNQDEIFLFKPIESKGTLREAVAFIKDFF